MLRQNTFACVQDTGEGLRKPGPQSVENTVLHPPLDSSDRPGENILPHRLRDAATMPVIELSRARVWGGIGSPMRRVGRHRGDLVGNVSLNSMNAVEGASSGKGIIRLGGNSSGRVDCPAVLSGEQLAAITPRTRTNRGATGNHSPSHSPERVLGSDVGFVETGSSDGGVLAGSRQLDVSGSNSTLSTQSVELSHSDIKKRDKTVVHHSGRVLLPSSGMNSREGKLFPKGPSGRKLIGRGESIEQEYVLSPPKRGNAHVGQILGDGQGKGPRVSALGLLRSLDSAESSTLRRNSSGSDVCWVSADKSTDSEQQGDPNMGDLGDEKDDHELAGLKLISDGEVIQHECEAQSQTVGQEARVDQLWSRDRGGGSDVYTSDQINSRALTEDHKSSAGLSPSSAGLNTAVVGASFGRSRDPVDGDVGESQNLGFVHAYNSESDRLRRDGALQTLWDSWYPIDIALARRRSSDEAVRRESIRTWGFPRPSLGQQHRTEGRADHTFVGADGLGSEDVDNNKGREGEVPQTLWNLRDPININLPHRRSVSDSTQYISEELPYNGVEEPARRKWHKAVSKESDSRTRHSELGAGANKVAVFDLSRSTTHCREGGVSRGEGNIARGGSGPHGGIQGEIPLRGENTVFAGTLRTSTKPLYSDIPRRRSTELSLLEGQVFLPARCTTTNRSGGTHRSARREESDEYNYESNISTSQGSRGVSRRGVAGQGLVTEAPSDKK